MPKGSHPRVLAGQEERENSSQIVKVPEIELGMRVELSIPTCASRVQRSPRQAKTRLDGRKIHDPISGAQGQFIKGP
jgi:hypothetical protein